jgi:tRNA threonylcarbamoyl adenosine modification protein YeaZ
MLVLVVDTSTPAVTAALAEVTGPAGATLKAERVSVDGRAHGELLGPGIETVLAEAGISPGALGAVVAGLGPGPFTGLRVGLVTAAAFGQTLSIPTYGVCSLDGLGAATAGAALVATDARRKEIYWAGYLDGVRVTGPAVDRPADLALGEFRPDFAVGEGAVGLPWPVRAGPRYPAAAVLAALAAERVHSGAPSEPLTPIYLRRPDAVEPGARKLARQ